MKNSHPCKLLAVAFVCALTSSAQAVDFGELVPAGEHLPVGQVLIPNASGTGTLIDRDIVLTAAHVVEAAPSPAHIRFRVETTPPTIYRVIGYQINPGYYTHWLSDESDFSSDGVCNDIAVLRLAGPVGQDVGVYQLPDQPLPAETILTPVGYGINETKRNDGNQKMSGKLRFLGIKDRHMICATLKEHYQRTDSGDSGGPLLNRRGNSWEIAGTVRGKKFFTSVAGYSPDEYGQYVYVYRHREWIRDAARTLQQIPSLNTYVYLKRAYSQNNPFPAMTIRQIEGFVLAGTPADRLLPSAIARGISEPISPELYKFFNGRIDAANFWIEPPPGPAPTNKPAQK